MPPAPARRGLRRSLAAGAVYDAALGLFIVFAGPAAMAALGHPPAGTSFYFRLGALPLLLLPALYLAAARSPQIDAFRGPVLWARGGGGAILLLLVAALRPDPAWLFAAVAGVDLALAVVHALLWRSAPDRAPVTTPAS